MSSKVATRPVATREHQDHAPAPAVARSHADRAVAPTPDTPSAVHETQSAAGNQALQRTRGLSGGRPPIDPSDSPSERAAIRMADTFVERRELQQPSRAHDRDRATQTADGRLSRPLIRTLERHLDAPLGGTRLHVGDQPARAARRFGARAFARGRDVYFGAGAFDPSSRKGLHLIAHELAHVAQYGRRATFDPAVRRQHDPSSAGMTDRDVPANVEAPLPGAANEPAPGEHDGQQVAMWGVDSGLSEAKAIHAGTRVMRDFATFEEASAYARGMGQPTAIFEESAFFVVYPVTDAEDFDYSDTRIHQGSPISNVRISPGVLSLVTSDGIPIQPVVRQTSEGYEPNYDTWAEQVDRGVGPDPFTGHRQAFGAGLGEITDKEQLLRQFNLAMRDTALAMLDHSETEAQEKWHEMQGGSVPEADQETVQHVAEELARIDDAITAKQWELVSASVGDPDDTPTMQAEQSARQREIRAEIEQLKAERQAAALDYPLLTHVDPDDFLELPADERAGALGDASLQILLDIETTRTNVLSGSLNLWLLPPLVAATKQGLGATEGDQARWIDEEASSESTEDAAIQIALAVLQIGFSIAAMAGGPLGVAFAVGALGVGAADAVMMTGEYFTNRAASNTAVNRYESLVPPDLVGHWAWVVVAWVGVGLDFIEVVSAVRMIKAGAEADKVIARIAKQYGIEESVLKQAFETTLLGKAAPDPLALEDILRGAMSDEAFAALSDTHVVVMSEEEWVEAFGETTAEAATVFSRSGTDLRATVFFRETGNPLALREEALHLEQAVDPETAAKVAELRDLTPEAFRRMDLEARAKIYRGKIELELNAQRRLHALGGDPDHVGDIAEHITDLEERLTEINNWLTDPSRAKSGTAAPGWVADLSDPAKSFDAATSLFGKPRLPRSMGRWSDAARPGNSLWYSDRPEVNAITGGEPIPFRNNYPVFSKWSKGRVTLDEMTGHADDFASADYLLAKRNGWLNAQGEPNMAAAARYREGANPWGLQLTWHHHQGGKSMMLVPTDLHANVPHTGGASAARTGGS